MVNGAHWTMFLVNGKNVLNRTLNKSESVRYLRLLVTQPMQSASGKDVRIYEMEVYE